MKTLNQNILVEQLTPSYTPAIKFEIQDYGMPAASSNLRFDDFGWKLVSAPSFSTALNNSRFKMCCPSDGSLVCTDGTTTLRFTSVTMDTDFSSLETLTAGETITLPTGTCRIDTLILIADPSSAEVMMLAYSDNNVTTIYPFYKKSTDYGATWGSWTALPTISNAETTNFQSGDAAYNSSGDILFVIAPHVTNIPAIPSSGTVGATIRYVSDTWDASWQIWYPHQKLGFPDDEEEFLHWHGELYIAVPNCFSVAVGWNGDWMVIWSLFATDLMATRTRIYYSIFGDGDEVIKGQFTRATILNTTDTTLSIRSFADLSSFQSMIGRGQAIEIKRIFDRQQSLIDGHSRLGDLSRTASLTLFTVAMYTDPNNVSWVFVNEFPICKTYILHQREDMEFVDGIFSRATQLYPSTPYFCVCGNSTYTFLYDGGIGLYMSNLPSAWNYPTVGTGAGDSLEIPQTKIIKIREVADPDQTTTLDITVDNSNDYFDSPGSGALAVLSKSSRVNLYLGATTGGNSYYEEYARYFVRNWEYFREPNYAWFVLHCVDAWGLLNEYVFPCRVFFNDVGNEDEKSVYDLIELMCQCIGGTLTYVTRSSSITSIYPRIEARAGDTAGGLMRRLLSLVPDQLRFFGNDGYIIYPQTSDGPVYYYTFPT